MNCLETCWKRFDSTSISACSHGIHSAADLGKLVAVDSSSLSLAKYAGKWAYCSKLGNGVEFHTKVVVEDDITYADGFICSTRAVADQEVVLELIVDPDVIHILDRGYIVYSQYKHWTDQGIRFVARIQKRNETQIPDTREVDSKSVLLRRGCNRQLQR